MDAMEAANTERRSIVVKARRKSKHAVEISVVDTGPGVAAEVTDTIFEPFVTTKSHGMGMGLSISHSIVEISWRPPPSGAQRSFRRDLFLRPADGRGGSER